MDIVTNSIKMAAMFNKQHISILNFIRTRQSDPVDTPLSDFIDKNFMPCSYLTHENKPSFMYNISQQGYVFMGMSLTGDEALQWRLDYVNSIEASTIAEDRAGLAAGVLSGIG